MERLKVRVVESLGKLLEADKQLWSNWEGNDPTLLQFIKWLERFPPDAQIIPEEFTDEYRESGWDLFVRYNRLETDAEYNKRVKKLEKQQKQKLSAKDKEAAKLAKLEAKERAQLAALKIKYENT